MGRRCQPPILVCEMSEDDDDDLVARACAGDASATAALLERLADTLEEVAELWANEGLPPDELWDLVAPTISGAIASYDIRLGIAFRSHALLLLRSAVRQRSAHSPPPLIN